MILEVGKYGKPLALGAPYQPPISARDIIISKATFDPNNPMKRPEGWTELKNRRILEKEEAARVDPKTILRLRPQREKEVETSFF
jgi:hypothetical protein